MKTNPFSPGPKIRAERPPVRAFFSAVSPFRLLNWLAMLWLASNSLAHPTSVPRDDFWVPDGPVNAIVETNGVIYIGGLFDYISPVSETGNAFDSVSGANLPDFPKFNGTIKAVIPDNAGGWFVGGLFSSVGG